MQVGGSQAVQSKQANPMQAVQGAIQGDLFYLHLVEDLVAESMGKGDVERKGEVGEVGEEEMMDSGDGEDGVCISFLSNAWSSLFTPSLPMYPQLFIPYSSILSFSRNQKKTTSNSPPILQPQTLPTTQLTPSTTTNRKPSTWTLQFRDIPEAGTRRPVTTRLVADIPITSGDAQAFMSALEYTHPTKRNRKKESNIMDGHLLNSSKKKNSHTSTHHLKGHRLTHNSTSILLFQPLIPPHPTSSPSNNTTPQPLTPNAYILQLSILITDGTNPALMERGVKELLALKELLKGVVEVDVVERGALDTRVR
ncbi:MAG: hypothetical protein Q9180_007928 [Flavoplaca navasiana]